jgi:hypothetical protein
VTAGTIVSLISAVFTIARWLVTYAQKREWMDQGAALVVLKSLQDADNAIAKAQAARDAVRVDIARHPDRLRDDDGFQRPGD